MAVTSRTTKQSLTKLPDDYSNREPPDPIPNSEVKPVSADGSVGFPHVRVGHRQASIFYDLLFTGRHVAAFFCL